jgi:hypothetical protein
MNDQATMKNISELQPTVSLQCPVEKLGEVWVQVLYFGKPTKRALDKTIELLIEMRNDYDE